MDTVTYETRTWLEGYCTEVRRGVWRMMRLPTRRYHVWSFFFHGFALTRLWFTSNQADSAKIKPNRVVSARDWNKLKQVEISLESCQWGFVGVRVWSEGPEGVVFHGLIVEREKQKRVEDFSFLFWKEERTGEWCQMWSGRAFCYEL